MYIHVCTCQCIFTFLFVAYPFPRFPPHMSPESDEEEPLSDDPMEESLSLPPHSPEAVITPYSDPKRRAEAAEKRK